jgi:SAM-dependent methyltransferase
VIDSDDKSPQSPYFRPVPYDFHSDHEGYLAFLAENARKSIMPFVQPHLPCRWSDCRVLELGCGEGGNLMPFAEAGAYCVGIDLNEKKIREGQRIMSAYINQGRMELRAEDIFNPAIAAEFTGRFHLIVLKDVIEHIPRKQEALRQMRRFLAEGGLLFIGWPPWRMPFGGHQQIARSSLLGRLPWVHLLPRSLYAAVLRVFQEPKEVYDELLEIHDYRVGIRSLNRWIVEAELHPVVRRFYLINPIYSYKFGLKERLQWPWLQAIPWLRDFFTTSGYYLLSAQPPTEHTQ